MPSIDARLQGHKMSFNTTWGLFSPKKIDEGTQQLLKQITLPHDALVLDLGCGYGAIGLTLAKEAKIVHMVDKDFVAVDFSQRNATLNNLDNVKVYLSNGFSHVPDDVRFDLIASNIPAKVGKEMLRKMLEDSLSYLNTGGKLYIVSIAGLKEYIKKELKMLFGNYKKLKSAKGYSCIYSVKQHD